MIVPYFIFEIGSYFWDWSQTGFEDESGTETMLGGTLAGFYQMTKLLSLTLGFSYTLYGFDTDFTATGIFAGLRFNMGQVVN